jgi:hypothetical protein
MSLVSINPAKKLEIDRQVEIANLDFWFENVVNDGFTTSYGWKMGLTQSDVILWTGSFVLAKEAEENGLPLPPVVDTDGVPHPLTFEQLKELMLAYGAYRAGLSAQYAERKAAIDAQYPAPTVEQDEQ